MQKMLLRGGNLIDETAHIRPKTDLLVQDGKIAAIGTSLPGKGCVELDCTGKYITPGFAVLHAHAPMHILRGLAEDVSIDDWFNREIFPYESKLLPPDIYAGARLCVAELLENGVTAFADHYFGAELVANAALDGGIKCDIAVTAFCNGGAQADIDETVRLLRKYAGEDHVNIRFGPHSPYLCGPQALRDLADAARKHGVGLHLHMSETHAQVEESYRKHGKTPFGVAADAGCFTVPCIAAHSLWVEECDIGRMAADTFVPVSPKTYLKLGMGKGGLWKFANKLNLCIGTDGAASSSTVDPLEQLRLFGLLGKWENHAEEFTLAQLWQMLMNGHRALRFGSGRLVHGAAADLNIWDLDMPATAPAYNPLAALIYSASPARQVLHTLVDGEFVKRDGRLLQDTDALVAQAKQCAQGILARGRGETVLQF